MESTRDEPRSPRRAGDRRDRRRLTLTWPGDVPGDLVVEVHAAGAIRRVPVEPALLRAVGDRDGVLDVELAAGSAYRSFLVRRPSTPS